MTTGQKVRKLRNFVGLTQEELAHKLGYKSKTSIAHIEQGRDHSITILVKLAKMLNTTPAYLMGWERDPEKKMYLFQSLDELTDEQFEKLLKYFEEIKGTK